MANKETVLIIGAGPTGLAMAISLLQYQIPFRIIDKKPHPTTTSNALAIQPRTLEVWDDWGTLTTALDKGFCVNGLSLFDNNKTIGTVTIKGRLASLYSFILSLSQSETEHLLIEHLSKNGIEIEFQKELVLVSETSEHASAIVKDKNGNEETIISDWLVACDGKNSVIREQLRLATTHKELKQHFVMGDVILEDKERFDSALGIFQKAGTTLAIPFQKNKARIIFDVTYDDKFTHKKNPSQEEFEQLIKSRCPHFIKVQEILWVSGFRVNETLIKNYRHNCIFFAGDAAHTHSPVGGQGMNTGIQDSYNLGWKLANVIKGKMKPGLLETYHSERYPIAQKVLARSSMMTRLFTTQNLFLRLLRNIILRMVTHSHFISKKILGVLSELAIAYPISNLTCEDQPNNPGPKAGERILDVYLNKTTEDRLLNYLRGPKPSFVFFSGVLKDDRNDKLVELLIQMREKYQNSMHYYIAATRPLAATEGITVIIDSEQCLHRKYQVTLPTLYFIRPDKYIGYRGLLSQKENLIAYLKGLYI